MNNEKHFIFIYDCAKCQNFIMLHQSRCIHCNEINEFFTGLQVDRRVEAQVIKELQEIYIFFNGNYEKQVVNDEGNSAMVASSRNVVSE
eukprot:CAMPEP_0170549754 /NCGR_PEP_ID=MMETSP0211-20121228/7900_1 /TAXON_ID=311385 /ORGANISM="Pseudokeronopsis sp., Strain OXSARD2" /LENGTH=88 /DNA_ID=CAMNT_0010855963 /DNA_START=1650 /DNA_END=1916 /DNA_ORIENTATION=+